VHYNNGLNISNIGIGSYIGAPNIDDDTKVDNSPLFNIFK